MPPEKSAATAWFNPFSSSMLQRRTALRAADDWAATLSADSACRFLLALEGRPLVQHEAQGLLFLHAGHALVTASDRSQWTLMGWFRDAPCILLDGGRLLEGSALAGELPAGSGFQETRPLLAQLAADEAALAILARGLQLWRPRHRYCGACGSETTLRNAGHSLVCTSASCGLEFFPRIDPAVIVAVSDGEQLLLGRPASWPAGRYSTLAGFVELGESLEDAVLREVHEEVGVQCAAPRYFASQAWPFPASLMLGFHASAERCALQLDGELEDARWFTAAQLRGMTAGQLPQPHTIARQLINHWYRGVCDSELDATP
jgi:NAD+ diphosphatase